MIESCDAEIAGWDEDGLTFTVKDPVRFETEIIPQFFKHSKFTSFVRVSNNMICLALYSTRCDGRELLEAWFGRERSSLHGLETHATLSVCFNSFYSN
jgi:HSF-type DNA-binding